MMTISAHASRWLVAFIAAPVLIWVIFFAPPAALFILVAVAGSLAWWEYFSAILRDQGWALRLTGLAGWLLTIAGAHFYGLAGLVFGLFAAVALGCLYFLFTYRGDPVITDTLGRFTLGHAYISLFFATLICLFALNKGPWWILYTLLVTMLGDTAAFYAGRTFGRTPLYPRVSPKKTWEGLTGAVVMTTTVSVVMSLFVLPVHWTEAALLGFILGFWGAAGDLFESMLKRTAGVKDSGAILMGHGGLWDRIDAILFNVPIIFFFALTRSF